MTKLIQFGDLTEAHFVEHPVWASCHSFDFDEPWFDQTDEETFRPWTGALPVQPADGMYLVRAEFTLADGTRARGFLTPADTDDPGPGALGTVQPQLYLPSGELVGFWLGMFGNATEAAAFVYAALGKNAEAVFPIHFVAPPNVAGGMTSGVIQGFYTVPDGATVNVGR